MIRTIVVRLLVWLAVIAITLLVIVQVDRLLIWLDSF